ncbi:MAG TPA: L,D-transpeptidase [Chloroflexia bacterium]|nr:L,D-transpeptidase [Chloroflexia bacterium]
MRHTFLTPLLVLLGAVLLLALAGLSGGVAAAQTGPPATESPTSTPAPSPGLPSAVPGTPPPTPYTPPSSTPAPATALPYTGIPAGPPPAIVYADPAITDLSSLWLGQLNHTANIRFGPGTSYAVDRVWLPNRRVLVYGLVFAANGQPWYQVSHYPEPPLYVYGGYVDYVAPLVLPLEQHLGRWIDVNLTLQTLIAFEDDQPVLVAQVATGKPGFETPVGSWRIYWRQPLQDMEGNNHAAGSRYYRLKDVPWIQYFQTEGDALHGTYWHDNFGRPMSHGCVNLSDWNALWLYDWASLGTRVEVHY